MATYFVDFVSGSDANNGTAEGTPWQHCPGDANATGTAAATSLAAADVVRFHAGVTYVGKISLNWSGTSGNPITYDGTTWTGAATRAIFTNNNVSSAAAFDDDGAARGFLTFTGIYIKDIGGYTSGDPIWGTSDPVTSPPDGTGIGLGGGGGTITITNSLFEEIGQWENRAPMSGTNSVTGTGVRLENNNGVTISSCDFTRMKSGISIKATTTITNITVSDCEFHNYMNWLVDIAPRAANATLSNITIDGCTFRDYAEFNTPNWAGFGEKPHQDGIFIRNTSVTGVTWSNVIVRNCLFFGDDSSDGGTASIYLSQGSSAEIYNCVFFKDKQSRTVFVSYPGPSGVSAQNVSVRNCTFYGSSRCLEMTPTGTARVVMNNVDVRNNLFHRTVSFNTVTIDIDDAVGTFTMDYNVFYNTNANQTIYTGSFHTLPSWQTYSSQDANSVYADPLIDVTTYEPQEGSPAIGEGVDLSAFFTTDKNGDTRVVPWDIGAIAAAGMPPEPPPADPPRFPAKRRRSSAVVATYSGSFGF